MERLISCDVGRVYEFFVFRAVTPDATMDLPPFTSFAGVALVTYKGPPTNGHVHVELSVNGRLAFSVLLNRTEHILAILYESETWPETDEQSAGAVFMGDGYYQDDYRVLIHARHPLVTTPSLNEARVADFQEMLAYATVATMKP